LSFLLCAQISNFEVEGAETQHLGRTPPCSFDYPPFLKHLRFSHHSSNELLSTALIIRFPHHILLWPSLERTFRKSISKTKLGLLLMTLPGKVDDVFDLSYCQANLLIRIPFFYLI
jgi:hypothetical protein